MREHHERFQQLGIDVVAVAPAAPFQAAALQGDMPFPLLLDPGFAFRDAVGLRDRLSMRELAGLTSGRNYARAIRRGNRQGMLRLANVRNRPAVLARSPRGILAWVHEGTALGDYPPVETVLAEVVARPEF